MRGPLTQDMLSIARIELRPDKHKSRGEGTVRFWLGTEFNADLVPDDVLPDLLNELFGYSTKCKLLQVNVKDL